MNIISIHLKEGMFERKIDFTNSANLIHSIKNSCGKTTLLRFILYGLGYNIPNTRNIKFSSCIVKLIVNCNDKGDICLTRTDTFSIELNDGQSVKTFVLPEQQYELHMILWNTSNKDIIDNLLGAFYVDQEKGWTLLNRGIVIGSNRFNIEALIRGLSNVDCSSLIKQEEQLTREIGKYQQMFSVAKYRETLEASTDTLIPSSYEEEINVELDKLLIEQSRIKKEIRRIDSILSENKKFRKYIAEMKLLVRAPDGTVFSVTEDNIEGLNDSIEILIAKRKTVTTQLSKIASKVEQLQQNQKKEDEQLTFFKNFSQLEMFDKSISRLPLNPISVKREIDRLQKEVKGVREQISQITKANNKVASIISQSIIKYAEELGIGNKDTIPISYLFTSNLKELSGAILHKTAFAFRLAYIIAIESVINIKLPIIMDSPSGKEVDPQNIKLMMDILERDFSDHQIIIASIYTYNLKSLNTIEIKDRLIEIR